MKYAKTLSFFCLIIFISLSAFAEIRLPVIFQSNMVLQRGKPCPIWGWASPKEKINVLFKKAGYSATADKNGKWTITLPAQEAGGPFDIQFSGKNKLTLQNILFGDVWICGGQSNMEFRIKEMGAKHPEDLKTTSQIRIFTATVDMDYVPRDDLSGGKWEEASAATVESFSAVAYFFGQYLQDKLHVPIGLISDNLGATSVETWMSPEALRAFPQFRTYSDRYLTTNKSFKQLNDAFEKIKPEWIKKYYHLQDDPGFTEAWYKPETNTSDWKTMDLPGYWEDKGLPDYDGSVWFRKEFDLPEDFKSDSFTISLGQMADYNIAWVNGHKIGEQYGNLNLRKYTVPASILQPKNNSLVLRILDGKGKGGLYNMYWYSEWKGDWKYKPGVKVDSADFKRPEVPNAALYTSPSVLYNGCITPLLNLSIKGAIWYQGEGNAARAEEYKTLFPAFITDWRKKFAQGDFPFFFVQLANFTSELPKPAPSPWAELRESQTAALALPNTGMAVTIDIGDANDIHPKNKIDVGKRLAKAALQSSFKTAGEWSSPVFDRMEIADQKALIYLKNFQGSITTNDKYGFVKGFSIAGQDSIFHWAKASIDNNIVTVFSADVKNPIAVRYAWANNPGELNLYNEDGLPIAPFRTDSWDFVTKGNKFSENPK